MRLSPECFRLLPQYDELNLILTGQVECPPKPDHYTGLPLHPEDCFGNPDLVGYSLADYREAGVEVQIKDHPEGLRVLRLAGSEPDEAYLFSSDFGDGPALLLQHGLATPATGFATKIVSDPGDLPEGDCDERLLAMMLLTTTFWAMNECEDSLGVHLGEAGIRLGSLEEARSARLIARLAVGRQAQFASTSSVLTDNARFWASREVRA